MPTGSNRLSAVARQRRLREAQATPVPGSEAGTPQENDSSNVATPIENHGSSESEAEQEILTEDTLNVNQFGSLVEAGAVKFSGTREIENVDSKSVKVRLSKGQKCVILGICTLWVKEGSVSVYGAIIPASSDIFKIYAPSTHSLPSVEAISKSAEFELTSVDDGLGNLPDLGVHHLWKPPEANSESKTFFVLGHSLGEDARFFKRLKVFEIDMWKSAISVITSPAGQKGSGLPRRILVGSRGSVDSSALVRCLINRMMTLQNASGNKIHSKGILLLDFDYNSSDFIAPGALRLTHVNELLIGPDFTHPIISRNEKCKILRAHFLGDVDTAEMPQWCLDRVKDLLDFTDLLLATKYKECTIILNAPEWIWSTENALVEAVWSKYQPTDCISLSSSRMSSMKKSWQKFGEQLDCRLYQLHESPRDRLNPTLDYKIQVQSYFHASTSSAGDLVWVETPILSSGHHDLALEYSGQNSIVLAVLTLGGEIALEDTLDVLEGSIVAILLVSNDYASRLRHSLPNGHQPQEAEYVLRTEVEDIPRLTSTSGDPHPIPAMDSEHIGLGFVKSIDISRGQIYLTTPISRDLIQDNINRGRRLILVVHRATSDGRFQSDWVRREAEQYVDYFKAPSGPVGTPEQG